MFDELKKLIRQQKRCSNCSHIRRKTKSGVYSVRYVCDLKKKYMNDDYKCSRHEWSFKNDFLDMVGCFFEGSDCSGLIIFLMLMVLCIMMGLVVIMSI